MWPLTDIRGQGAIFAIPSQGILQVSILSQRGSFNWQKRLRIPGVWNLGGFNSVGFWHVKFRRHLKGNMKA